MGKLIDADILKNVFDTNTWQGETLRTVIDNSPTAYDVDKVVEQLEKWQLQSDDGLIAVGVVLNIVKGAVKE